MPSTARHLVLLVLVGLCSSIYGQATSGLHVIAEGIEITLPKGWLAASRKQIAQFEVARDRLFAQNDLRPKLEPREVTTFQAEKEVGGVAGFVGITIMPGEASQAQVSSYSVEKTENLAARLIEQHKRALFAARCTGVSFSAPALQDIGGKKAIGFEMEFTTPDGVKRAGTKQYVYMRNATVILNSAAPVESPQLLRDEMANTLTSVKLNEN